MRQFTQEEQNALLEILARHDQELCAFKGVYSVDVGIKFENGHPTEQLAIRVHVHEKLPESLLESSEVIPKEIEGIPVDIIQSNPTLQQSRDHRFDPLVGGIAVKNTRLQGLGTLGAIVYDATSSLPLGLSNHHVLVSDTGQVGDEITQPATSNKNDVIGSVLRWNKELDCAVCSINNNRLISNGLVDFPQQIVGIKTPLIGMSVTKSGRTTGTTFAIIDGVSLRDYFTMIPDPQRPSPNGEISLPGDSGSVWLETASPYAVGLHFAGESSINPNERAWAKKMDMVANALNIKFQVDSASLSNIFQLNQQGVPHHSASFVSGEIAV